MTIAKQEGGEGTTDVCQPPAAPLLVSCGFPLLEAAPLPTSLQELLFFSAFHF